MFMVQLLVKFRFFIQELWERKSLQICMNVDDERIMRSQRSCLFILLSIYVFVGIVLAVGFDDIEALETLWTLHERGKLSTIFQDVIITSPVLKKTKATKIVLRSKLLESEYNNCKNELLSRKMSRLDIKNRGMVFLLKIEV